MPELSQRMHIASRVGSESLTGRTDGDVAADLHELLSDLIELMCTKLNLTTTEYKDPSQKIKNDQFWHLARAQGLKISITVEPDPDPVPLPQKRWKSK